MLPRDAYKNRLKTSIKRSPVTAIIGPRQCGKTTLARQYASNHKNSYFDLEDPVDKSRLENASWTLKNAEDLIIIDEIQLDPSLFPVIRVLVDEPGNRQKFLILGSASPLLIKNASESLAGRIEFIELSPFSIDETSIEDITKLWTRGGFPRSFLAKSDRDSSAWREAFIRTFLERDIPQLGINISPIAMRRFWTMISHYHGQIWNSSDIGRSLGISDKTARSYLDILSGTFMLRQIQPWFENISKRQVKAPKMYFRDTGILHHLLGIDSMASLENHPKLGASWEGFALESFIRYFQLDDCYFWSSYSGSEIDLLFFHKGKRFGLEAKFSATPKITKSMKIAKDDLGLEHIWILTSGTESYTLSDWVNVLSLNDLKAANKTSRVAGSALNPRLHPYTALKT